MTDWRRRCSPGCPQGLAFTEDTVKRAVIHTAAELTRAPEKFTPQSVQPLFNSGLNQAQALEVILTTALYAGKSPAPNAGRCRIFHRRRLKTATRPDYRPRYAAF